LCCVFKYLSGKNGCLAAEEGKSLKVLLSYIVPSGGMETLNRTRGEALRKQGIDCQLLYERTGAGMQNATVCPTHITNIDHDIQCLLRNVDFVKKQSYLNGFFCNVRPLQSLEITHLYDNIQNNATSKALIIGFSQTAKLKQVREFFVRGKEISNKHIETLSQLLHKDDLPSLPLLDHLVTNSTFAPFSDKLMIAHKLDMFSMRINEDKNLRKCISFQRVT
jgi:hypothetical protein